MLYSDGALIYRYDAKSIYEKWYRIGNDQSLGMLMLNLHANFLSSSKKSSSWNALN